MLLSIQESSCTRPLQVMTSQQQDHIDTVWLHHSVLQCDFRIVLHIHYKLLEVVLMSLYVQPCSSALHAHLFSLDLNVVTRMLTVIAARSSVWKVNYSNTIIRVRHNGDPNIQEIPVKSKRENSLHLILFYMFFFSWFTMRQSPGLWPGDSLWCFSSKKNRINLAQNNQIQTEKTIKDEERNAKWQTTASNQLNNQYN